MSISGIGMSYPVSQSTATTRTVGIRPTSDGARSPATGHPDPIATAAKVLGLSVTEVVKALSSGSSLADLAQKQGVSRDDLVAALVADAPAEVTATGNVEAMVKGLVDQTGMGGPGGGPPPAGSSGALGASMTSDQQDTVDALSALLGTDPASLLDKLRSGVSLGDLLSDAGVSTADLAGVVEDGLLIDTSA